MKEWSEGNQERGGKSRDRRGVEIGGLVARSGGV